MLMYEFLYLILRALDVPAVRYSETASRIKRVAGGGGAGIFLKKSAVKAGADAFVTADIKYHDCFTGKEKFRLIDAGHDETAIPVREESRKEVSEAVEESWDLYRDCDAT